MSQKQITVITGMRRVGKTTALKYLLSQIKSENKIYIDLEKIENRYLFSLESVSEIEAGLKSAGIRLDLKAYIALDEIQLLPAIVSVIKYLHDTHNIKFIVTGSSSFYIKNRFSESLAGRKRIFELFPFSFREYATARGEFFPDIQPFEPFNPTLFYRLKPLYDDYLQYGGFPEVALAADNDLREAYLKDIINAYIELDIKLLSDFEASGDLYSLLRLLASRAGSKTDLSKLAAVSGIRRDKIRDYLDLMSHTYILIPVTAHTKNTDREISLQKKYYLSDTGLLHTLTSATPGMALENAIAIALRQRHSKLNYYARKTGQEIDFIVDGNTAIEVKDTPSLADLNLLQRRCADLDLKNIYLFGNKVSPSGFRKYCWAGTI